MTSVNAPINHTFSATGVSPSTWSKGKKTLTVKGSGTFVVAAEVSHDYGVTFTPIEEFSANTAKNFDWDGAAVLVRFHCTTFDTEDIDVIFA